MFFSVYIDELLHKLKDSGVGCYMGCGFAGVVCYADDLGWLAPSPSALRIMLHICEDSKLHGLRFNARFGKGSRAETQYIFNGIFLLPQQNITLRHTNACRTSSAI